MRATIAILLIIVGVLAWQLVSKTSGPSTPQSSSGRSARESMELQKMCADQAKKFFDSDGSDPDPTNWWGYENHHNDKLNKCFILKTVTITGKGLTAKELFDAFEGTQYANDLSSRDQGTILCWLFPPGEPKRACASDEEFSAFVATYMQ
jgi:hypothetical protein